MILFVTACVREEESRTKSLARTLLEELEGEIEVLDLAATELPCLDREMLGKRDAACRNGEYSEQGIQRASAGQNVYFLSRLQEAPCSHGNSDMVISKPLRHRCMGLETAY